jgi:hypothetical protein
LLLCPRKIAPIRVSAILSLNLTIDVRILSLNLRHLTLSLAVLPLLSPAELRHLSLRFARLLTKDLSVLLLRLTVPLWHLSLELWLLTLNLRLLSLHLRELPLSLAVPLRHLPLHLRLGHLPLHLRHWALCLLPHLRLRLLPLHLWRSLTLHLRLTTAASAITTAAVSAPFALRVHVTKAAQSKHQQRRKKCDQYGSGI